MSWDYRGRAVTVTDHTMSLQPFEPLTLAALRAFVDSASQLDPICEIRITGDGQDDRFEISAEIRESVQLDVEGPQKCPDCEFGVRFSSAGDVVAEVCETCSGTGRAAARDE
ncbi:hypothetical protein [Nocardia sp. NPDC058633]|uniref:hypothetical protein n=1 Tax=Nocardia sp. NPDC058633 TaxID=3346568 RepID=UPI00364B0F87